MIVPCNSKYTEIHFMDLTLAVLKPTVSFNSIPTFLVIWTVFLKLNNQCHNYKILASFWIITYAQSFWLDHGHLYTYHGPAYIHERHLLCYISVFIFSLSGSSNWPDL